MPLRYKVAIPAIALSVFGLIMIYSASSYSAALQFNDDLFYVKKQFLALIVGLVMMVFGYKVKIEYLDKARYIIYLLSVILLAILFIPGVGMTSYGATRWINLGFITLQPSEIAKFGIMFFLASIMSRKPPTSFKKLILPLLSGMVICILIMLEPNMSITMCVLLSMMILIYVAGAKNSHFALLFGAVGTAVPLLIVLEPYRIKRLFAFIDPWQNPKGEGYQLIQSYFALGSGGLFGVGLFNSRQKYLFLPFAESDFIFSVIGEELGVLGSSLIIVAFLIIIINSIKIALKSENAYSRLLVIGIAAVTAVQTLINIAVVSGSIPPTGVPLPFVSAGGSSLMVFLFCVGVIMNVDKAAEKKMGSKLNL